MNGDKGCWESVVDMWWAVPGEAHNTPFVCCVYCVVFAPLCRTVVNTSLHGSGSSLNFLRKAMLGGFMPRWAGQLLVISAKHQFVGVFSGRVFRLVEPVCQVVAPLAGEVRGHVHWEAVPIPEGGWFRQQALVGRLPTTGDSCDGRQELHRKAQDTTPLEFRVSEFFLAEGVQFSRICEVRHQENLSNVFFYIQDADQCLRNELSGMVQFVPKDVEEKRVRQHSEDPVQVLGLCFRGSDGDVAVDRRGGGGHRGRCKGSASRAARRPGVHVTQRGLGSLVACGCR